MRKLAEVMTLRSSAGSTVGEAIVAWSVVTGGSSWSVVTGGSSWSVVKGGSWSVVKGGSWSVVRGCWLVSVKDAGCLVAELDFENGLRLTSTFLCCVDGCEHWSRTSNGLSVLGFLVEYWYILRIFRMLSLGISLSNSTFLTEPGDC